MQGTQQYGDVYVSQVSLNIRLYEYLAVQNNLKDVCIDRWYDPESSPGLDVGVHLEI